MKLRFLGKNLRDYKGIDGFGGLISVRRGDVCEVNDKVGSDLMKFYSRDFEVYSEEKGEHAPKKDKELRKSPKFKAK